MTLSKAQVSHFSVPFRIYALIFKQIHLWSQKQPHSSPSKTVQTNPKLSTLLFVLMSKKKQKINKTLIIIFFSSFMCQIRLSEYISINCYHWQKDKEDWFRWNMNKIQWQRIVSELDESWIPDGKAVSDNILSDSWGHSSSFHCMQYITCPGLYTNMLLWVGSQSQAHWYCLWSHGNTVFFFLFSLQKHGFQKPLEWSHLFPVCEVFHRPGHAGLWAQLLHAVSLSLLGGRPTASSLPCVQGNKPSTEPENQHWFEKTGTSCQTERTLWLTKSYRRDMWDTQIHQEFLL